ncbi:hypothetical protein [[Mycoplasma] anseris]|uniref:Uncharacterized protein n=1 Tax=[Mycoplasma] anseris TaxID=92400 RepID=A0A2Z4NCX7_9BACT|nr:hypothetical protein [[Mycoplasma] anseris]AWX69357.1 hypothetical protein DP065_01125 [[Mycoplasma] anseris]
MAFFYGRLLTEIYIKNDEINFKKIIRLIKLIENKINSNVNLLDQVKIENKNICIDLNIVLNKILEAFNSECC